MDSLNLITKAKKILITASSPIDPDAIGSGLALLLILEKMGKQAEFKYSFDRLGGFGFLPGADRIQIVDTFTINFSDYDLAIFLDGGDLVQFADSKIHREEFILPKETPVLNIDHHPTNSHWTPHLIWEPQASSTCEVLYKLFKGKVEFDKAIATNLYTGISADTGHFRYANTTKEVMTIAGDLLSYGVDLNNLMTQLYDTASPAVIKFSGFLTSKIEVNTKLHYSWFTVSLAQWQGAGLSLEDLKNAFNRTRDSTLRAIDGTDFTFCLSEEQPGYVGGSFRSRKAGIVDLSKLAQILGGGGHKEAAGFLVRDKTLPEAERLVHDTIKAHYSQIKVK